MGAMDESAEERQDNELVFLSAAFGTDEAWCDTDQQERKRVCRRLVVEVSSDRKLSCVLCLVMPSSYPVDEPLEVSAVVEETRTSSGLLKSAFDAQPRLIDRCRETAASLIGQEAIFEILGVADEWTNELAERMNQEAVLDCQPGLAGEKCDALVQLGRRLIYSHHIISNKKRSDIRSLASEFQLTGYVKIGWPGIIIVEGREGDCQAFYDTIRRWAWQYLVVRGEMQESVESLEEKRLFTTFEEVSDMSIVADHCRNVGLEALFRTSMKVYEDDTNDNKTEAIDMLYGALILVDHMNDGRGYRKWLRKTSDQLGVGLIIKECSEGVRSYKKRPIILVALVGRRESVATVLKKWRTTRVDADSRGKPCLERMTTVALEGALERQKSIDRLDWASLNSEEALVSSRDAVVALLGQIGGASWNDAARELC